MDQTTYERYLDLLVRRKAAFCGRPVDDRDEIQAGAEALFCCAYKKEPLSSDFVERGPWLDFLPVDDSGQRIRLVVGGAGYRTWPQYLNNADLCVFATKKRNEFSLNGWMHRRRIMQAQMVNGAYEIGSEAFEPMPLICEFIERCPHVYVTETMPGQHGGVWAGEGWQCFGCEQIVYDARTFRSLDDRRGYQISA